jgi:hypothetical protein
MFLHRRSLISPCRPHQPGDPGRLELRPRQLMGIVVGIHKSPLRAPHWYSLPRRIWAPLPPDSTESEKIVSAAVSGDDDVISMPQYYKAWDGGLPSLREQLKKFDDQKYFGGNDKEVLRQRMQQAGLPTDQLNTLALTGRAHPLMAVFDPSSLRQLSFCRRHSLSLSHVRSRVYRLSSNP